MPVIITEQNQSALMPLFKPWEEPVQHRLPNPDHAGGISLIVGGRRPSKVGIVRAIRAEVDAWRSGGYAGVSRTSQYLLNHWFRTEHLIETPDGESIPIFVTIGRSAKLLRPSSIFMNCAIYALKPKCCSNLVLRLCKALPWESSLKKIVGSVDAVR